MTVRGRMLRDLLVLLTVWPAIVREALDPLPDDEQFAVAAALEVDAEACLAMLAAPDAVTPFGPAANLCRRLLDLVDDMPPATAARLQQYAAIFTRLRDADAHHQLFTDDVN